MDKKINFVSLGIALVAVSIVACSKNKSENVSPLLPVVDKSKTEKKSDSSGKDPSDKKADDKKTIDESASKKSIDCSLNLEDTKCEAAKQRLSQIPPT